MADSFDVIVIGGGPAGYPAAIRAAQNKLTVACIDEWKNRDGSSAFGGTCLNAGCIPSKALLESTELYHRAQHEFAAHGVKIDGLGFDVSAMQKRKGGIVRQMTQGILGLFKAAGVTPLAGHGRLLPGRKVEFTGSDGAKRTLQAKHVVLASGSEPMPLRGVDFDGKQIVDSWGALEFEAVPEAPVRHRGGRHRTRARQRVAAARCRDRGAGSAGPVPAHSGWRAREGSAAAFQEAGPRHPPRRQGLRHESRARTASRSATRTLRGNQTLVVDRVIVAIGRRPFTKDLLADGTGVVLDPRGFIQVDDHCRTGAADVWAVGDCVRGPMLAHKGKEEGVAVADRIAGLYGEVNYKVIPSVIYTAPEIAWVGQTEEQAKAAGRSCKIGSFPFAASGRAKAMEGGAGFCKVVADAGSDEILGIHIIGPMAGELIAEAVLAMEYSASSEDLQRTIHAHPTLSEAVHEAALAADKRAIDIPNR